MNERTLSILDAAQLVFAKYGVSKTTMSDIAQAAGVARQTVYNAFATKNDILRAAVRVDIERSIEEVKQAWSKAGSFEERIEIFHNLGPVRWYQVIQANPDLAELLDGHNPIAAVEMEKGKEQWEALFLSMFDENGISPIDPDLTRKDLADFMYYSGKTAKYGAKSEAHVERRLKVAKKALLGLVQS